MTGREPEDQAVSVEACADPAVDALQKAAFLGERFGWVQSAVLDSEPAHLRESLIALASVTTAWLEAIA